MQSQGQIDSTRGEASIQLSTGIHGEPVATYTLGDFQQTSGQSQDFSLVISGNLDPEPARPEVDLISRVNQGAGEYLTFTFHGFVGVTYQLEESEDLLNWSPAATSAGQSFPPVTIENQGPLPQTFYHYPVKSEIFYRLRKVGP